MLFDEIRSIRLMTPYTEARHTASQERIGVTRCMGVMAGEATLGHWGMLEPDFADLFSHLLMTSETEFVSFIDEIGLVVSAMGVVAFHAVPISHYLVDAFRVIGNHLIVAGVANPGGVGCKQLPMSGSVGIMAANTVTLFERSMDEGLSELGLECRMTPQAKLAVCSLLQFEFQGIILGKGDTIAEEAAEHEHNQGDISKIH